MPKTKPGQVTKKMSVIFSGLNTFVPYNYKDHVNYFMNSNAAEYVVQNMHHSAVLIFANV